MELFNNIIKLVCYFTLSLVSVQIITAVPIQSKDELGFVFNTKDLDLKNKYYLQRKSPNSDSGNIEFHIPLVHFPDDGRFRSQQFSRIYFPGDIQVRHNEFQSIYRSSAESLADLETTTAVPADSTDANMDASMPQFFPVPTVTETSNEFETLRGRSIASESSLKMKIYDKNPIVFETSAEGIRDSDSQISNRDLPLMTSTSLSDRDSLEIKKLRTKLVQLEKLHKEKEEAYKFAYWSLFQTPNVSCPSGTRKDQSGRCVKLSSNPIANARYSS